MSDLITKEKGAFMSGKEESMVKEITIKEFLKEKEIGGLDRRIKETSIGYFIGSIFVVSFILAIFSADIIVIFITIFVFLFPLILSLLPMVIVKLDYSEAIKKGDFSYEIETCVKVYKKDKLYIVATKKDNLYEFSSEVKEGDQIVSAVIGKNPVNAYCLREDEVIYSILDECKD